MGSDPIIFGERYYSQEFASNEWDRMWTRVWQIAGRVDQIPTPGDYINYEIMHESIICVRGQDSQIRAFYNACQHREINLLLLKWVPSQVVNSNVHTMAGDLALLENAPGHTAKMTFRKDRHAEKRILWKFLVIHGLVSSGSTWIRSAFP